MNLVHKLGKDKYDLIDEIETAFNSKGINTVNADAYWLADIDEEYISRYDLDILNKTCEIIAVWKSLYKEAVQVASQNHINNFIADSLLPTYFSVNVSESASQYRDCYPGDAIITSHCHFEKLETENFYIYILSV